MRGEWLRSKQSFAGSAQRVSCGDAEKTGLKEAKGTLFRVAKRQPFELAAGRRFAPGGVQRLLQIYVSIHFCGPLRGGSGAPRAR